MPEITPEGGNVRRLSLCLYSENITGGNMRKQVTCLAVIFIRFKWGDQSPPPAATDAVS